MNETEGAGFSAPATCPPSAVLGLLSLVQLSDSFFPTGMFAHSLGLEGMVRRGRVQTLSDVERFIRSSLSHSVISADGVALLNAHRALRAGDLNELAAMDQRLFCIKAAPELRLASQQHGRRLLVETALFREVPTLNGYRARVLERAVPGTGAVALGAVSAALDVEPELALAGYLHTFVVGVVSAAIRLLPLSNTDCQLMVHRLHPSIAEQMESIRGKSWLGMTAFTPELDIVSMQHAKDDLRMFAS
ncbi:MAG: urease accessory protein UreF [Chloroflexota bacterium]